MRASDRRTVGARSRGVGPGRDHSAAHQPAPRGRVAGLGPLAAASVIALTACTSGSSASTESAAGARAMATNAAAAAPERDATAAPGAAAGSSSGSATDGGLRQPTVEHCPGTSWLLLRSTAPRSSRRPTCPSARGRARPGTDDAVRRPRGQRHARAARRSRPAATTARSASRPTAGGFVASADGGGSQMSITLRVPADQYDAVLDKIAALGQVTNRTESRQDVTAADRRRQQPGRQHDGERRPGARAADQATASPTSSPSSPSWPRARPISSRCNSSRPT